MIKVFFAHTREKSSITHHVITTLHEDFDNI